MASAGAAGEMVQALWDVPGSSDTIIDATFLSHRVRTMKFLGIPKGEEHAFRFCSEQTALRLAAECYVRGREAIEEDGAERPVIGIGMTATCKTSRPQKGAHRVHIALRVADGFHVIHAEFDKEQLERREQGVLCDLLALNALLTLTECGGWSFMEPGIMYPSAIAASGRILRPLESLTGGWSKQMLLRSSDGSDQHADDAASLLDQEKDLIFPGSYNPLHHGHLGCGELAAKMTGMRVVYQLTAVHPDKGIIPDAKLFARADQFAYRDPVLLMREGALYVEKARLLPGFRFLIGADAAYGLLNPKYYDGQDGLLDMLETLRRLKTQFYVMGRVVDGKYRTVSDIPIPRKYHDLFQQVSGRYDISSTERRAIVAPSV
jgi:nicotinamide mononucleotide (NMN) deamidase PncC